MRRALAALIAIAAAAPLTDAAAERYCAVPGSGPPNCAYATLEQCRSANAGAGRCSPMSWVETKPARRAVSTAAASDPYPRMLVDPKSHVQSTTPTVIIDRQSMGW
jgi:hypothetical protein